MGGLINSYDHKVTCYDYCVLDIDKDEFEVDLKKFKAECLSLGFEFKNNSCFDKTGSCKIQVINGWFFGKIGEYKYWENNPEDLDTLDPFIKKNLIKKRVHLKRNINKN